MYRVSFSGTGTDTDGTIVSYSWDFGDSSSLTEQNPTHTYAGAGDYTAILTVTDNDGATGSASVAIHVESGGEQTTITLQQGVDGYSGLADAWITNDHPDTNYGSDMWGNHLQGYNDTFDRALFKFDLSSIPQNTTITSATFELYITDMNSNIDDVGFYKILKDWDVNSVTYNQAKTGSPWSSPGMQSGLDYKVTNYDQMQITTTGWASFDVKNLLQEWVTDSSNYGFFLKCDTQNNGHYKWNTSEVADTSLRPKLTVTYTIGDDTIPPGDVTGFTATPGVGQVSLSWTNPSDSDFAGVMIRYRTDGTYPTNYTDGTAVPNGNGGKIPGQPNASGSYIHTGLDSNLTYYYSAFTYDTSENYSDTAHASATPLPSETPNQPPEIVSFTATPSSLNNPGESTTFNVSATDPDGDALTYTISFGDGTSNGSGNQVVHTYETKGTYTAEVSVDDGHGHIVGESLQVTVNDIPPAKPTNVTAN